MRLDERLVGGAKQFGLTWENTVVRRLVFLTWAWSVRICAWSVPFVDASLSSLMHMVLTRSWMAGWDDGLILTKSAYRRDWLWYEELVETEGVETGFGIGNQSVIKMQTGCLVCLTSIYRYTRYGQLYDQPSRWPKNPISDSSQNLKPDAHRLWGQQASQRTRERQIRNSRTSSQHHLCSTGN